ncbi:hypothetical protein OG259_18790 [Streptomyces sp. NBC_00250]|uniref:hypothetical protein n=1 Tax=Streptomyces sp. NBC_00250 TaxID=2903641 RepID=UPI002E292889|nr:hypothetical protein [Streptomyces sp. NBC_00250]
MSIEAADSAARLKTEQNDPDREEWLRQDSRRRRRKIGLRVGVGVLLAGAFGFSLFDVAAGEGSANEPFEPGLLEEAMWPDDWPLTTGLPFRGSPAARWDRTDVASSMLPPYLVRPVAGISKEQVTNGLNTMRDFVREANVSDEVLTGERPERALALLAPGDPTRRELEAALERPVQGRSPLETFTRFDPDEVVVLEDTRARGSMTYEATPAGELLVHADYTFVYAVLKTEGGWEVRPGRDEVARVVVRRRLSATVREGKLVLGPSTYVIANDACPAPEDGFIHPLFSKEAAEVKGGKRFDPYAAGTRLAGAPPGICLTPTRT